MLCFLPYTKETSVTLYGLWLSVLGSDCLPTVIFKQIIDLIHPVWNSVDRTNPCLKMRDQHQPSSSMILLPDHFHYRAALCPLFGKGMLADQSCSKNQLNILNILKKRRVDALEYSFLFFDRQTQSSIWLFLCSVWNKDCIKDNM